MMVRETSWRTAPALLALAAFAPGFSSAADQCSVDEQVVAVWDGAARDLGRGPLPLETPAVQVTTITGKPPVIRQYSASPASAGADSRGGDSPGAVSSGADSATAGATAPVAAPRFAPKPPRPVAANDQERLFTAVFEGELAEVRRLLDSPAIDVNAPARSDRRTSLIDLAAGGAQPQIVRALIERGARVRGPGPAVDIHPIAMAVSNLKNTIQFHGVPGAFAWRAERTPQDFETTIRVLLDAGADADGILDPTHPESALLVLLSTPRFDGDMRIARLLLEHGAQFGGSTPGGSPLAAAVARGRDDFLDLALAVRHLDPAELDAGLAPAVARHEDKIVAKLLAAGASPDARDPYGRPLLCVTLMGSNPSRSLALLFLTHGAHVTVDCIGAPPLNLAMSDHELALMLLDHGADPSRPDHNGATALNLVADSDHELIDALLRHGAQLGLTISDQRNSRMGMKPLGPTLRAISYHQDYLATGLLRRDGLQSDTPCAAVLYAAALDAHGTLAELLHRGADPNSMTQRGATALMSAANHGNIEAVRILLAQPRIEVDQATPIVFHPPRIFDYNEHPPPPKTGHRTALMYAAAAGHAEICTLLRQHGASPRETDAEGMSPLDYAASPEVRAALMDARVR